MAPDSKAGTKSVDNVVPEQRVHKNSNSYQGDTDVHVIRDQDGVPYKIGESAQGRRVRDGKSIRAEGQVRDLGRKTGQDHSSQIRKTFDNKADANSYETNFIQRFRRLFGFDKLPGNKGNH